MYGSSFGIVGAIYQASNASVHHRPGAHCTRFNCNKQITVSQAMVTNGCTSFAEGDDLGVSRGIRVDDIPVPSAADDLSVQDDDGADRDFSYVKSTARAAQSFLHAQLVGRMTLERRRVCTFVRDWFVP